VRRKSRMQMARKFLRWRSSANARTSSIFGKRAEMF
jgi:hypothetical protein